MEMKSTELRDYELGVHFQAIASFQENYQRFTSGELRQRTKEFM